MVIVQMRQKAALQMNILRDVYDELDYANDYGHYLATLCPWHDDNKPSLLIYEDKYYCKACSAGGFTESFLQKLQWGQVEVPTPQVYDPHNPFTGWLDQCNGSLSNLIHNSNHAMRSQRGFGHYLESRNIGFDVIQNLKIGFMEGWYIFPIFGPDDKLVGVVARCGGATETNMRYSIPTQQDPNLLYVPSWERVENHREVFLTFGIIDAISIYQLGYAAMSTTTGKTTKAAPFDDIRKTIWIFPDNWEERTAYQLAANLGWRGRVLNYNWRNGIKDPNDLLQHGKLDEVIKRGT